MSTFTLPNTDIPVTLTGDLTKEELLKFEPFKSWLTRLQTSLSHQQTDPSHEFHSTPYNLKSIKIESLTRFAHSRLGFLKIHAHIANSANETLPGSILLRGPSVGMLVVLQPDDLPKNSEEEKWVLLTVQPRPAAGTLRFTELPAGMVDGATGSFEGTAAKEIKEELGMEIKEEGLINLTNLALGERSRGGKNGADGEKDGGDMEEELPNGMFPSAGACDEYIPLFLHERRVPRDTLKEWQGKLTGLRDEGEKITLKIVRLEDLWREGARDAKALGALALWEGLKRSGALP